MVVLHRGVVVVVAQLRFFSNGFETTTTTQTRGGGGGAFPRGRDATTPQSQSSSFVSSSSNAERESIISSTTTMMTQQHKEAVSGAIAGFAATIALHPLDVIKTRLQVQDTVVKGDIKYKGTVHALKTILKSEGARGAYAGLSPAMVGNTASWAMYFAFYDRAKKRYEMKEDDIATTTTTHTKTLKASWETLLAATEAGVGVSVLTNPIWVAKTRLALQERGGGGSDVSTGGVVRNTKATKVRYKGLLDCLYSIARNEGVPGLYKGLTPSLLLVSHGAIQFTCYENLKNIARGGVSVAPDDNDTAPSMEQRELTSTECAVYGMLSKILASFVTYPQQVVRARMQKLQIEERNQIKYKSVLQSFGTISRREGISGMYKGMVPNLARMLPSTGVTFFTYEFVNRMFRDADDHDDESET